MFRRLRCSGGDLMQKWSVPSLPYQLNSMYLYGSCEAGLNKQTKGGTQY